MFHSIKDTVVNTRHENILDVFNIYKLGEKFATGEDGHSYSSSRDEPSEQYLSVDVREVFIVHVGGTRCVTSSTDNNMKIHARITLKVEFIRTCIFLI